jgi:hypothetical protein
VTFNVFIPKIDFPMSFEDFRSISLCNYLYKIMENIIVVHLKPIMSSVITQVWFPSWSAYS